MLGLGKRAAPTLRQGWTGTIDDYGRGLAFTASGESLVVADASGVVQALDARSGERRWIARDAHPGGALAVAAHPRSDLVASAGQDGRCSVREGSGGLLGSFDGDGTWIEQLAWSPAGRQLAVACGPRAVVLAEDLSVRWSSERLPSTVSGVGWGSEQELVATCYGRVTVFAAADGAEQERLEWQGSLISLALDPAGEIIACGSQDNTVHFWRRATGADSMMSGYPGKPKQLAFDSTGTLLATGGSSTVTVWCFLDGGPEGTSPGVLDDHDSPVSALAFSPKSRTLASGARDGGVRLWQLDRQGAGRVTARATMRGVVEAFAWRGDGRGLAAVDGSGQVRCWRV